MVGLFQTRERRALVVFLLLAGVFVAGLLLAERRKSAVSADRVEAEMEATVAADSVRLFEFDPNTVEYADLRRLGLSSRMAVSLLKYRAAGKVFRIPEDVATCYGMTDSVYFNKSVDRHINLTNRLLRRFFRGLSNDLENVLNSLLCVTISSNNPC